ncbi:uncharacterized protein LOC133389964 [Rhineura floridana]|uniref:uncharacterized protein LOC133376195 n=2 Tax=Rhineura floridana TaxID=261503 RepID=UPI002AC854C6|nr:uncharacterized protein LOC133376195 [Rhineura floridana]XP_061464597.1 uncharacterized protein LOC133376460 [Rhineura floridana]XP_061465123.1 uncharacterized protein LOC133376634 [Rhineura floridana]XP_061469218.1 uncharacterized protein LOC133378399 [Rhineura floridana]XP_061471272.1 uncharacterized protein LOC133379633 [Rhineura floridana]XP_061473162.1 uncharacterized protein LOC133380257 [Rhineura floridana]XP_061473826.1 uncharacterized protein LOC133380486 [Rhineura floridana]XP_0
MPKKGQGGPKGKGKAPRAGGRCPPPAAEGARSGEGPPWAAILARLEALEHGSSHPNAPRDQPVTGKKKDPPPKRSRGKTQRPVNSADAGAVASILARLDVLEAGLRAEARTPSIEPGATPTLQAAPTMQPAQGPSAESTQDRWTRSEQPRILLCGHSMMFWAGRRAAKSRFGTQLGLSQWAAVRWLGRRGMRWDGLLPALFQPAVEVAAPQVLVIHLGGNDLGLLKGKALIEQACGDLRAIARRWPGVHLVWSDILPRRRWNCAGDPRGMDRARKKVNRQIQRALRDLGGSVIHHPEVGHNKLELFRPDGVHLTDKGNDIFLRDLQKGLHQILIGCGVKGD